MKTKDNMPFGVPNNVKRYFIKKRSSKSLHESFIKNDGKILIPSYKSIETLTI